jgi:hypothetical protein
MTALKALKRSPMALDLYAWATYRTFTVSVIGKPALRKVQVVFPTLRIADADGGFMLLPSRPAVSPRSVQKS